VAQPIKMSRTPAAMTRSAPDAGAHTDEVLAEYGLTPDEISALRAQNAV
jgi:crotonobetainyl-CoA:carnitine CoA-transferase CaiB-like acyl-CoA transferase